VSVTSGSVEKALDWCPIWTNGCQSCDGSCNELLLGPPGTYDAPIASLPLGAAELIGPSAAFFPPALSNLTFSCEGGQERGGACTLLQSPVPQNGNIAIIDFDDNAPFGPSLYTATLGFDARCDTEEARTCVGSGLVQLIPDDCVGDGGLSVGGDSIEVYCVNGISRFCLSGEGCPWRNALIDTPETCSRAGLDPAHPTFLAEAICQQWKGIRNYECDANGRVFFPANPSHVFE
jgi:hypothetical protein